MLSVFSVAFGLLRAPIPTLKEGITIGDTIDVIVVALAVAIVVGAIVALLSSASGVILVILIPAVVDDF